MVNSERKKVAIGCQGGGMHVAFAVGVLKAILERSKTPGQRLAKGPSSNSWA